MRKLGVTFRGARETIAPTLQWQSLDYLRRRHRDGQSQWFVRERDLGRGIGLRIVDRVQWRVPVVTTRSTNRVSSAGQLPKLAC